MTTEEPFTSSDGRTLAFGDGNTIAVWRGKLDKDDTEAIAVKMGEIEFCMLIKNAVALVALMNQLLTTEEVEAAATELQINKIKR